MSTCFENRYEDELVDLKALIAKVISKRWWLIGCVVLSVAIFTTAAFTIKPVYRASALLISASAERSSMGGSLGSALGQLGGLASLVGVGGGGDSGTEEALAVLRSRQFTSSFIEDNKLMPVLFPDQWDATNNTWKIDARQPSPENAYDYFNKIRTAIQDKKTGLVTLQVDWTDRIVAAEWANQLVERLNGEMRSRAIAKADASLGYLQKELLVTSTLEVREAINRLIEGQIKQRMLANVTQEYSFRVVDKAVAPDKNNRLKPNKRLLVAIGPIAGLLAGIMLVLLSDMISRLR